MFPEGTIIINNWLWDGDREWSGLRTPKSSYYSTYSQHTYGRAFDLVFSDYTAEEVREYILANQILFPHINRLEDDVSWLHFDLANTGEEEIQTFKA